MPKVKIERLVLPPLYFVENNHDLNLIASEGLWSHYDMHGLTIFPFHHRKNVLTVQCIDQHWTWHLQIIRTNIFFFKFKYTVIEMTEYIFVIQKK